jgi:uncharacterized membrane protein (DUF4010 family)
MFDSLKDILSPFFLSLLVSTGIGLIVGLEREFTATEQEHAGIRTFPITAILGCVIAHLSFSYSMWLAVVSVFAIFIFVGISHYVTNIRAVKSGITTEVALIVVYCLGLMTGFGYYKESLATVAIITTLLSLKGTLQFYIKKITQDELYAFVKFLILALLILPVLPKTPIKPIEGLNLFDVGVVVVVISFLNFISYLLMRFVGAGRGILLTAIVGGIYSSTAVTWVFASKSRENPQYAQSYAAGIIVASSIMFLRVALITVLFNSHLIGLLSIPTLLLAGIGLAYVYYLIRKNNLLIHQKNDSKSENKIELGNPMNILSALGFGLMFIVVAVILFYANQGFGSGGIYLTSIISGLADVDAFTINIAKFTGITTETAVNVIVITTLVNTVMKFIIGLLRGSTELKKTMSIGMLAILIVGIVYLVISLFR